MPGLFGGIGCEDSDIYAALRAEFLEIWGGCESHQGTGWALGSHGFHGRRALFCTDRYHYAVDGDYSVYAEPAADSDQTSHDLHVDKNVLELGPNHMGNIALIDTVDQTLHLTVEWSGTFPLYFVRSDRGILFSSHLRPLARVTQKPVDALGLLEFLRDGFTFGGRTIFADIRRVLPGQSVRYSLQSDRIAVSETSRAWLGCDEGASVDAIAVEAWRLLDDSVRRSLMTTGKIGLMMSGGWDSRTLLAAIDPNTDAREGLICYSHGDTGSRELNIVARLARSKQADCRLELIDDRVLDLHDLSHGFNKVENVVFPHWHRAGRLLSDMGVVCATAGVYGEVLGGHYGPSRLLGGHRTIIAVASSLLRPEDHRYNRHEVGQSVESLLRLKSLGHHWYLNREFEDAIPAACERINGDVEVDLLRLRQRGIGSPQRLIEAFTAEHRGSHYINAQLLSCRAHVDIAMPFAERALLAYASRVPLNAKIHNALNRRMLRRHAAKMLRFPMAATLVPASAPLMLQEMSRLLRRTYEEARLALHDRTHGRIAPPRLGWVEFEFLRSGDAMRHLVDDLQSDYWDRHGLEQRLKALPTDTATGLLHPIYNQMAKVYTADLLLR